MTDENAADYYCRRERQERLLAERAQRPEIRRVHLDLAERYRSLRRSSDEGPANRTAPSAVQQT